MAHSRVRSRSVGGDGKNFKIVAIIVAAVLVVTVVLVVGIVSSGKSANAGDVNGDGTIDNKDLVRFFHYLSKWDVEVEEDALDVNGDNKVDNRDLVRLSQNLAK